MLIQTRSSSRTARPNVPELVQPTRREAKSNSAYLKNPLYTKKNAKRVELEGCELPKTSGKTALSSALLNKKVGQKQFLELGLQDCAGQSKHTLTKEPPRQFQALQMLRDYDSCDSSCANVPTPTTVSVSSKKTQPPASSLQLFNRVYHQDRLSQRRREATAERLGLLPLNELHLSSRTISQSSQNQRISIGDRHSNAANKPKQAVLGRHKASSHISDLLSICSQDTCALTVGPLPGRVAQIGFVNKRAKFEENLPTREDPF